MRNVTWIVHWFRFFGRPLPLGIALALGCLPASHAQGQEPAESLAPVLRLARPYPELKTPPAGGGTTTLPTGQQANTSRRSATPPQATPAQQTASSPQASQAPQAGPAPQASPAKPAITASDNGWVASKMIGKRLPLTDPKPDVSLRPIPAPTAAAQGQSDLPRGTDAAGQPNASVPNTSLPNASVPPVTLTPATVPPAAVPPATVPPATVPPATLTPATLPPANEPAKMPLTSTGQWQRIDAAEIPSEPDIEMPSIAPAERLSRIDRDAVAPPAATIINSPNAQADSGDAEPTGNAVLERMLGELRQMTPVQPMKSRDGAETPAGELKSPASESVEPPASSTTVEGATRPVPLIRPQLAPASPPPADRSNRGDVDQRPRGGQSAENQPRDAASGTESARGTNQPTEVESGQSEVRGDFGAAVKVPGMTSRRDPEIPVRRPDVSAPRSSTTDGQRDGRTAEVLDNNTRARNLQDQIERFERGEGFAGTPHQADSDYLGSPQADMLDAAAEPVAEPYSVRPKSVRQPSVAPAPVISAAIQRLDQPIRQCLIYHHQRPENAAQRTPWGMLHAILPYGLDANIDASKRYNAIAYLAGNNPSRNLRMLATTRGGRIVARSGVGLQGHQAQMLAIFAQAGVPAEYPLFVNKRKYAMSDLVQTEMLACKSGEELTFTLIGLSHYLPTDSKWRAADGQNWDFERLLKEELGQPVVGAACGGTHRLMGLSYALRQRRLEGLPITGQWARAEAYLKDFTSYAWQLQNRDGSFSTEWFEGRADNGDQDRKVQTSGHILEWLLFSAEDDQLQDERFTRAVTFLTSTLVNDRSHQWQVGPKGHALRALSLYHRRVFQSDRPWVPESAVAEQTNRRGANR
jgi:hypothetical protein